MTHHQGKAMSGSRWKRPAMYYDEDYQLHRERADDRVYYPTLKAGLTAYGVRDLAAQAVVYTWSKQFTSTKCPPDEGEQPFEFDDFVRVTRHVDSGRERSCRS